MGSSAQWRDGASPPEDTREDRGVGARHVGGGFGTKKRKELYSDYFYFLSDIRSKQVNGREGKCVSGQGKKSLKESLEELYSEWPGKMPSYMVNLEP